MNTLVKAILPIVTASMLLISSGCQSGPDYRQGFDFTRYHTFAILALPTKGTYQEPAIAIHLGRPGTEAIVEQLTSKGFKETGESEADFLVNMKFDYIPEQNRTETRMLDIQIIDGKSREIVWSTWLRRTTDMTMSPEAFKEQIARLIQPFPPGSHPAGQ